VKAFYPLGYNSPWQNNELRYSLRSLAKHCPDIESIYLVGECPEFAEVEHIYLPDCHDRVTNIWRKMETIAQIAKEPFLFMADDIFFTAPEKLPMFYDGDITKKIEGATGQYKDMMIGTKMLLEYHNMPTTNYALHYPLIVYPNILKLSLEFKGNYSWRTIYCNLSAYHHRQDSHERTDCKLWKHEEYIGQTIFSISDRFLSKKGMALFTELYPEKCKFEK